MNKKGKYLVCNMLVATMVLSTGVPAYASNAGRTAGPGQSVLHTTATAASKDDGWQKIQEKWYYFQNGQKLTGWYQADGTWYYSNSNGEMMTGWISPDKSTWYYLDESGAMLTGWQFIDRKWYYLSVTGTWENDLKGGWNKLDGNWYYMNLNGSYLKGWLKIDGQKYYMDDEGKMTIGWLEKAGERYYFNQSGIMVTGKQNINGKSYEFDSNGVCTTPVTDPVTANTNTNTNVPSAPAAPDTNQDGLYIIEGTSSVTVEQLVRYYQSSGSGYPFQTLGAGGAGDLETFCQLFYDEAKAEGIKVEVAFTQAMKETGWLSFGGDVSIGQYNFAGLGATGGGVAGIDFSVYGSNGVKMGIRAQIQHLKAYASSEPLNQTCVDNRFSYVQRNSSPYVEWLGIPDNPFGGGWAAGSNYGSSLVQMIETLKSM